MALSCFLQFLHDTKCPFQMQNQSEIDDLESAVHEMIQVVFQDMIDKDHRMCFSTIIPVGGYYDGTKILNPDEFDFMAVWDAAPSDEEFEIEISCPGCVTMVAKVEEHWTEFVRDGKFLFSSNVNEAIPTFSNYFDYLISNGNEDGSQKPIVSRENGNLHFIGSSSRFLSCSWESCSGSMSDFVDIDVMPCIKVPDSAMPAIVKDVPKHLYKYVQKDGCHVVPKNCSIYSTHSCSQISFTRAEVLMILDMSDHHIKCYKTLKYIGHLVSALCFDSYAMKNAILHHCFNENCLEIASMGSCVIQVYKYLKKCSDACCLPSVLRPDRNIWEHSMVGSDLEKSSFYQAQSNLAGILILILQHIDEEDINNFDPEASIMLFQKLNTYLRRFTESKMKFSFVEKKMIKLLEHKGNKQQPSQSTKSRCEVL